MKKNIIPLLIFVVLIFGFILLSFRFFFMVWFDIIYLPLLREKVNMLSSISLLIVLFMGLLFELIFIIMNSNKDKY